MMNLTNVTFVPIAALKRLESHLKSVTFWNISEHLPHQYYASSTVTLFLPLIWGQMWLLFQVPHRKGSHKKVSHFGHSGTFRNINLAKFVLDTSSALVLIPDSNCRKLWPYELWVFNGYHSISQEYEPNRSNNKASDGECDYLENVENLSSVSTDNSHPFASDSLGRCVFRAAQEISPEEGGGELRSISKFLAFETSILPSNFIILIHIRISHKS